MGTTLLIGFEMISAPDSPPSALPVPSESPQQDQAVFLKQIGSAYPGTDAQALTDGFAACTDLARGTLGTTPAVERLFLEGMTRDDAAAFVVIAVHSLCPVQSNSLPVADPVM